MYGLSYIRRFYESKRQEFDEFLKRCANRGQSKDSMELFKYLCCNILASQAKWENAEMAVEYLDKTKHLFHGNAVSIHEGLKESGYRSPNNVAKAQWLYEARRSLFDDGCEMPMVDFVGLLRYGCDKDPVKTRDIFADRRRVAHVPGLGMKEASHFLRGLGLSHNQLAILDSVVVEQLVCYRVIEIRPKTLSRAAYLVIEDKEKAWAKNEVGISLDVLDLLLWKMGRKEGKPR